jgi:hypothetical protein
VDVKVKMHKAVNLTGKNLNYAVKSRRNRAKSMIDRESAWCLLTVFLITLQTGKLLILKWA